MERNRRWWRSFRLMDLLNLLINWYLDQDAKLLLHFRYQKKKTNYTCTIIWCLIQRFNIIKRMRLCLVKKSHSCHCSAVCFRLVCHIRQIYRPYICTRAIHQWLQPKDYTIKVRNFSNHHTQWKTNVIR